MGDDESKSSPSQESRWGEGNMSDAIYGLRKDVSEIRSEQADLKVRQAVLEETQSLVNTSIRESVSALTDNVKVLTTMMGRMEIQSINTEKNIELKTKELEFKIQQATECNKQQDDKLEKLSVMGHAKVIWDNPLGKFMYGVVAITLAWIATRLGLPLDQILK